MNKENTKKRIIVHYKDKPTYPYIVSYIANSQDVNFWTKMLKYDGVEKIEIEDIPEE